MGPGWTGNERNTCSLVRKLGERTSRCHCGPHRKDASREGHGNLRAGSSCHQVRTGANDSVVCDHHVRLRLSTRWFPQAQARSRRGRCNEEVSISNSYDQAEWCWLICIQRKKKKDKSSKLKARKEEAISQRTDDLGEGTSSKSDRRSPTDITDDGKTEAERRFEEAQRKRVSTLRFLTVFVVSFTRRYA